MDMDSPIKKLEAMSDEFLYQIKRCEDYYGAWKELTTAITHYNEQICIAKDFFSVTFEALLNSLMMELIKLYDQQRDAISITKLLDTCKSVKEYAQLFDSTPDKKALYKKAIETFDAFRNKSGKNTITTLITRRDKYYMHNDGQQGFFFDIQALVDRHPFSFEDIEILISEAKTFSSTLYRLATNKEWEPFLHQGTRLEHIRDFTGLQALLTCTTNLTRK